MIRLITVTFLFISPKSLHNGHKTFVYRNVVYWKLEKIDLIDWQSINIYIKIFNNTVKYRKNRTAIKFPICIRNVYNYI